MAQQPVIEGGIGTKSWSTEEGAKLTEQKDPQFRVRLPLLSEIFTKAHKAKVKDDKIAILKKENCRALQQICQWAYNPTITSDLPEGKPPYVENDAPEGTEHNQLTHEARTLFHYIRGGNPKLSQNRRENMFIQLLEGLHENEAELVIAAKDKSLHRKYKGLSSNVVKEAFNWNEDYMIDEVVYPQAAGSASGIDR